VCLGGDDRSETVKTELDCVMDKLVEPWPGCCWLCRGFLVRRSAEAITTTHRVGFFICADLHFTKKDGLSDCQSVTSTFNINKEPGVSGPCQTQQHEQDEIAGLRRCPLGCGWCGFLCHFVCCRSAGQSWNTSKKLLPKNKAKRKTQDGQLPYEP
jgi:hypothetical protein